MVVEGLEGVERVERVEGVEGVEREVWRVLLHKMRDQLAASLSFDLDRTTLLQAFSPCTNFLQDGQFLTLIISDFQQRTTFNFCISKYYVNGKLMKMCECMRLAARRYRNERLAVSRVTIVPEWPPVICKLYPRGRQSWANCTREAASHRQITVDFINLHTTGGHAGTGTICMYM